MGIGDMAVVVGGVIVFFILTYVCESARVWVMCMYVYWWCVMCVMRNVCVCVMVVGEVLVEVGEGETRRLY